MVSMISWLREHPRVAAGGACVVALAAGVGVGRYSAPTKVETREVERVVEVVRWRDREVVTKGPVKVVTRTVTTPGPQGPTVTVDRIVEQEKVVTVHTQGLDTTTEVERLTEKVVTRDAPRLTLGATVGYAGVPTYGGFATIRILGPLTLLGQGEGGVGVWSARAGVGISF
jgi:hypothetical protein